MLISIVWALMGTLGYALVSRMRGSDLIIAAFGGAIAWAAYILLSDFTQMGIFAYLAAALAAGSYAELMANLRKKPATIYAIPGVISLVPGGGMYFTLSAALAGEGPRAASLGLETLLIAGMIAAGIAISSASARLAGEWAEHYRRRHTRHGD